MASRIDPELMSDARHEMRSISNSNSKDETNTQSNEPPPGPGRGEPKLQNESTNQSENTESQSQMPPPRDEFKEKFDEYFKGMENIIAGTAVTEIVDDFKTKFLYVYAKKQGVDIPMEALKMDEKSKKFCAFLVDHAIKNKMFDWIKKYPLIAAGGVVAISAGSSYLFIQMMKSKDKEAEEARTENENLKRQIEELTKNNKSSGDIVKETISSLDKTD